MMKAHLLLPLVAFRSVGSISASAFFCCRHIVFCIFLYIFHFFILKIEHIWKKGREMLMRYQTVYINDIPIDQSTTREMFEKDPDFFRADDGSYVSELNRPVFCMNRRFTAIVQFEEDGTVSATLIPMGLDQDGEPEEIERKKYAFCKDALRCYFAGDGLEVHDESGDIFFYQFPELSAATCTLATDMVAYPVASLLLSTRKKEEI